MKIKIMLVLISLISLFVFTSCNKQIFDTTYTFDYAYIKLQNDKVIEGHVESWTDFHDGDQLQITINGITYLVHSCNCTLISYNS